MNQIIIESIGWIGTALLAVSFLFKNQEMLRIVNAISCIFWIVYGILIHSKPVITVDSLVLITHIIYWVKNNKSYDRNKIIKRIFRRTTV